MLVALGSGHWQAAGPPRVPHWNGPPVAVAQSVVFTHSRQPLPASVVQVSRVLPSQPVAPAVAQPVPSAVPFAGHLHAALPAAPWQLWWPGQAIELDEA